MNLLILVIYSKGEIYDKMLELQRLYLHTFKNVHSYFIDFRENQTNLVEIEKDMIYVKGKNSYLNITYKTIESLSYMLQLPFNYIIRTNISTIINIPELYNYCLQLPKTNIYRGGNLLHLKHIDVPCGIIDNSLWGTNYIQGTSIIMSNDIAKLMILHKSKIRYDVIDDVAIGVFIKNYTNIVPVKTASFFQTRSILSSVPTNYIFYRNNLGNRNQDIINMKKIIYKLHPPNFKKLSFV